MSVVKLKHIVTGLCLSEFDEKEMYLKYENMEGQYVIIETDDYDGVYSKYMIYRIV